MNNKSGKNHSDIRAINTALIIDSLLGAPDTVINLAQKLKLSYSAVVKIVNCLILQEILITTQNELSSPGRPSQLIDINPECVLTCVIDLSQRNAAIFFVDAKGYAFQNKFITEFEEYDASLAQTIITSIKEMKGHYRSINRQISNIHIVTPSKPDSHRIIQFCNQLAEMITKLIPSKVVIGKDIFYAINGETKYGCLLSDKNALMFKVDRDISFSAIIDGVILKGKNGSMGNISDTVVNVADNNSLFSPLNRLSTYATLSGLKKTINSNEHFSKKTYTNYSYDDIFRLYNQNAIVTDAVNRHAQIIAYTVFNYASALDIDKVILYGGIVNFKEEYLSKINQALHNISNDKITAIYSQLGDFASLRGAIWESVYLALIDKTTLSSTVD